MTEHPLRKGELLWITEPERKVGDCTIPERQNLWTVARPGKTRATIIRTADGVDISASLIVKDGVPVDGRDTVRRLNSRAVDTLLRAEVKRLLKARA